jgi:hypothetical protein
MSFVMEEIDTAPAHQDRNRERLAACSFKGGRGQHRKYVPYVFTEA